MKELFEKLRPVGLFGVRKQLNLLVCLAFRLEEWRRGAAKLMAGLMEGWKVHQEKIETLEDRIANLEAHLGLTETPEGDGEDSRTDGSEGRPD